jgi:hypothetical protein
MYQPFFYQNEALGIRPQAPTAMQALVLCKGASKISLVIGCSSNDGYTFYTSTRSNDIY